MQATDFCFAGDCGVCIASRECGCVYDIRNRQQAVGTLREATAAVATMQYDNFALALNSQGRISIYQNSGLHFREVEVPGNSVGDRFNVSYIDGS